MTSEQVRSATESYKSPSDMWDVSDGEVSVVVAGRNGREAVMAASRWYRREFGHCWYGAKHVRPLAKDPADV
jgi:hypothetical protein